MIGKKYKGIVIMGVIFLLTNISLVSCTSNLLKPSKTSSIDEDGNRELLGKVTCIDGNKVTLAVGNECDLEIINEEVVDESLEGDNNISFKSSGEEKVLEIEDDSLINKEDKDITVKGSLNDITIGSILSVEYNDSNNLSLVVIKDNSKYSEELNY